MKLIISLGAKHLVLEPETTFEKEVMSKYFQESDIEAFIGKDNVLRIKFSGPAGREFDESQELSAKK